MSDVRFGYTLSGEETDPRRLVELATMAEAHGFDFASISDHYHPWLDEQGHAPFVWSVLGAIAARTSSLEVGVGVTCPILRVHPAVLAQATATTAQLFDGRFVWGVGTGEALNEHILGLRWPPADLRLEMLEEAIGVIRALWSGESVTHRGPHYTVEDARLYDTPPGGRVPLVVSAFGTHAARAAARCGDGLWTVGASGEVVDAWRESGGRGPVYCQLTCCIDDDRDRAVKTAHRFWRTTGVPGQLSQDLPTPKHFEMAASVVSEDMVAESMPCGPDLGPIVEQVRAALEAGATHVYLHQVGPDQERFFAAWDAELRDALVQAAGSVSR